MILQICFNRTKRGQAALEFLMSYGWAMLVVIAAVSALVYVGVLSPQKDIATTCTLPPGIFCEDVSLYSDRIYLSLRNGGPDIFLNSVQSSDCIGMVSSCWMGGNARRPLGDVK